MTPHRPIMHVSLRESRMVLERLAQWAGVEPGLVPTVRECALCSAALPVSGFASTRHHFDAVREMPVSRIEVLTETPVMLVDAQGQHAWLVAESLLDLAVDKHRRADAGIVSARNVGEPQELRVIEALAERHGVSAQVSLDSDEARIALAIRSPRAPTLLEAIRHHGIAVPAVLWWDLYELSQEALAPDSFESRRHAGPVRVEPDGSIVGRADEDETDFSLLTPDVARVRAAGSAQDGSK